MNSRKPLIIAVIAIVVMIVIALVLFLLTAKKDQDATGTNSSDSKTEVVPPLRTSDELMGVVVADKPSFKDSSGKLNVKLSADPQRLDNNWYVIRIVPTTYENDEAKLLLYDPGKGVDAIKVVMGPGTAFPDEAFIGIEPTVPEIVKAEMNR